MSDQPTKIFCFSGLGADERLFGHLDIDGCVLHAIRYAVPTYQETIEEYTRRLADVLKPTERDIFLGVSFGGMIAQELARIKKPRQTIIISSLTDSIQLPKLFQRINNPTTRLIITKGPTRWAIPLLSWLNGVKSASDRKVLTQMAIDSDQRFMRWGMQQLLDWQAPNSISKPIHIHGTADRMIPYKNVNPTHTIEAGSHFMVMDRADEISRIISQVVREDN